MDDVVEETEETTADAESEELEVVEEAPAIDVEALLERLAAAERRADELAIVSRRQSDMADELHKENRRLRDGELQQAVAPLIRGLARVADDLHRIRASRPEDEDLAHIDTRVREVLHDSGATTVRPQFGDPFDPRVHQAAGSAPTHDGDLDRTVAVVRREGLALEGGKLLRPADVVVHRYVEPEILNPTGDESK
jgi:molecular chaperone GrpE (heat shock protein)